MSSAEVMQREADIVMVLPVPPSANRIWRNGNGRTYKSDLYRQWLAAAGLAIEEQTHGDYVPDLYAIEVVVPKSRKDLDNHLKPISDLLEDQGVIVNDNRARRIALSIDAARSDVLVRLWALPAEPKIRKARKKVAA